MNSDEKKSILAEEQRLMEDIQSLIEVGQVAEAIELLTRLTEAGSRRADAYRTLGLLHETNGNREFAVKYLQTAASLELSGTDALRDLVRLYVDQHEYGKAIGCLALVLQRDGPSKELMDVVTQLLAHIPADPADLGWVSPEVQAIRSELERLTAEHKDLEAKLSRSAQQKTSPSQLRSALDTDSRMAFLIHSTELLNHYRNICQLLRSGSFVFLVHSNDNETPAIEDAIRQEGWVALTTTDVLREGRRFRSLVSNHPVTLAEEPPLIKQLADINIRLMYAAGKLAYNLSEWNRLYDVILCFGPYHAEHFLQRTGATVIQIGYPRFDAFFNDNIDRVQLASRLNCDPRRKTVVWLPTWSTLSSVGHYDDAISALLPEFNVVVKVHPLMASSEPAKIDALERRGFNYLIRDTADNLPLYRLADHVLCDYGGPAFGAIYTDRNLLLLNVPGAENDELLGADSTELAIRHGIINVNAAESDKIGALLADAKIWEDQAHERARLRRIYFAPYFGFSSRVTAAVLENVERVVRQKTGAIPW